MKAITIHQPWATLIAVGAKKYETRGWKTNYRGPILIHAGLLKPSIALRRAFPLGEWSYAPDYRAKREFLKAVGLALGNGGEYGDIEKDLDNLPLGAIVATAELWDCQEIEKEYGDNHPFVRKAPLESHRVDGQVIIQRSLAITNASKREIAGNELLFGDWTPGRHAWEPANVQMLPEPIPAKGQQGLWDFEMATVAQYG